ncbi:MAG: hypothetical protein AB7T19_20305 [Planctomycetota bacterium]
MLRTFWCCRYAGGELPSLPWADAVFDCIVIAGEEASAQHHGAPFADVIVRRRVDYVQTTGPRAEWLHDLIDEASVRNGRQDAVGDGSPMTTWHDDALSFPQICEVAECCFGSADDVLCVVLGSEEDRRCFTDLLRERLSERS